MEPLSPDTQATLLLVGRFAPANSARPLSNAEYRRVAEELHALKLRPADLLREVPDGLGIEPTRLSELLSRGTALALAVERWGQLGIKVIGRSDPAYPPRLRARLKGAAAPVLFAAGAIELLKGDAICIVGSRDASESGLSFAKRLGGRCVEEGLAVVSGDAKGIDRAAMDGALNLGGHVVAVLADSLGKAVLTKRHRDAILGGRLALVSPYNPEAPFTVAHAMDRNKYLYALAIGAVIVDSAVKGGTWSGAIENARHGWVPALVRAGVHVPPGNQALIAQGLTPITNIPENADDGLVDLLANSVSQIPEPQSEQTSVNEKEAELERDDAPYSFFLERLCVWLETGPRSEEAVAARFDLEQTQVKRWLARGSAAGAIAREGPRLWGISTAAEHDRQTALPL
jgi:predicted Rossmann fold nucleotide-binding protein DprA/Smf involved in DNA uptake